LEVFGKAGYLAVNGLGGSYGAETLEWGRRKAEGGRPDIDIFEFTRKTSVGGRSGANFAWRLPGTALPSATVWTA